jgi:Tfp pilus assembly protein FimT
MPLILSGSVDISGSMTATTILVSSPGAAGMVSSSAQITELAPLMAYTASLKGAEIVSSSQQIQNYFTFARTGSVNTFFGNQGISGSLNVTSATGTNVTPQLTVNNTTTNGYGILRLVGAARGGLIDFYNTSSAQASIVANDGELQFYTNGDSTGTPKVTINSNGNLQSTGVITGTRFTTSESTVAIPNSATNIFDPGSGASGVWMVTAVVQGNGIQAGYAIVGMRSESTLYLLSNGVGGQMTFSVSGTALRLSQSAGGTINTSISVMKMNQGG